MNATPNHSASPITGPFASSEALAEGWVTRRQLYSPLFTQLFRGVHLPAAIPVTHVVRCRGAALAVPSDAVLTGLSAAAVRGIDLTDPDAPVELVVPEGAGVRVQRGMNIRRTTLRDIDSEPWDSIRVATPLRMALDLLTNTRLHTSLPRRVAALDMLLREDLLTKSPLRRLLSNSHDDGIVAARQALALADSRAESMPESEMRVWLAVAGVHAMPQLEVRAAGRFLGRLDLGIEECKLGIEYDGEWHDAPEQAAHDIERRDAIRGAGWEFVIVRRADLYGDPRGMVATVREAIKRRTERNR